MNNNNNNTDKRMTKTFHADDSDSIDDQRCRISEQPGTTTTTTTTQVDTTTKPSAIWTRLVNHMRAPVVQAIKAIAVQSATYPKYTIAAILLLSFGMLVIGLFTNFSVDVDEDVLWTPMKSHAINNMNWLNDESGFPLAPRLSLFIFHADGDPTNVLTKDFVRKSFIALDAVRNLPDYPSVCARFPDKTTCDVNGILQFWNNSLSVFDTSVSTDQDILDTLAQDFFPDGTPVALDAIVGNIQYNDNNMIVSAQSFTVIISLPEDDADSTVTAEFEKKALDVTFDVQKELEGNHPMNFRVETFAERSFADEFGRAIIKDIPLVPIVFVIMGVFTSAIFYKKNRVQSRSTLGFMAVVSILLSICAGYGLMFVCGVPFTSMTQILPFVFFGVGLDDAFIITGSFFRMNPKRDVVERIGATMDDIGLSIFLTTLTSCLAFGLSCISSIPAVFWLCIYAVPTMALILLWQLTFFVACLAIDERRMAAGKGDGIRRFLHCSTPTDETPVAVVEVKESTLDRLMVHYAHFILKPVVKLIVIMAFIGFTVACGFSTAELRQAFTFTDVLPAGSYITGFFTAVTDYTGGSSVYPDVYFRNVDQSDPFIRAQMEAYLNELVNDVAAADNKQPDFCWFRDFDKFVAAAGNVNTISGLADETFTVQLGAFLANDVYNKLYSKNIVLDNQTGAILASRCLMTFPGVDLENVVEQIDTLKEQLDVTERQPINQGKSEFSFFTYESSYNIWEFYAKSGVELASTTILSVVSVAIVTLLLVPHWTAGPIVLPMISILYIDMLGVLQWAGISVNPVSYISLVMSIGLLVDFLLHVLLRYYECPGTRHEKIVEMLRTMGSSVLVGGITTFLGTLPLAFSTSDIFQTVFIAFLALVVLGIVHGLLVLPVILSIIGTEDRVSLAPAAVVVVLATKEAAKPRADGVVVAPPQQEKQPTEPTSRSLFNAPDTLDGEEMTC